MSEFIYPLLAEIIVQTKTDQRPPWQCRI